MCFVICIFLFYAGLCFIIFSKSSCLPILFVICILYLNLYVYFICFRLQKKKCMCFVSLLSDFQSNIYTHDAVHVAQMIDTRARYPSHFLSFISEVSLCSVISWYFWYHEETLINYYLLMNAMCYRFFSRYMYTCTCRSCQVIEWISQQMTDGLARISSLK